MLHLVAFVRHFPSLTVPWLFLTKALDTDLCARLVPFSHNAVLYSPTTFRPKWYEPNENIGIIRGGQTLMSFGSCLDTE